MTETTGQIGANALIVEGGAMRAVFSCGILDTFLNENFNPFDSFWGVSAGASNLAAYLANMPGRNLKIYTDYSCRKEFIRPLRLITGNDMMDLDWLWQVTIAELGLDIDTIQSHGLPFYLGVTQQDTGNAEYLPAEPDSLVETMKASSALPILYRNGVLLPNGNRYVDGGVADAIPVAEAIRRGAKRIMVLRSQPYSYIKQEEKSQSLLKRLLRKTPELIEPMCRRATRYNQSVELMRNPPQGIEIIEICPPESFRLKRLTRQPEPLYHGYQCGQQAGVEAIKRWKENI